MSGFASFADILDVLLFKRVINSQAGEPSYDTRLDLNTDSAIDVLDVLLYKPILGTQCVQG